MCAFEDCERESSKRGLCYSHYRQSRLAELPYCSFEGCEGKVKSKGLCPSHQSQILRGHDLTPIKKRIRSLCTFEGCDQPHKGHGLCHSHLAQLKKGKQLTPRREWKHQPEICYIKKCERPSFSKGMCDAHYRAFRKAKRNCGETFIVIEKDIRRIMSQPCICGAPATSLDHIYPVDRGGRYSIGNLQGLCVSCNSSKHTRLFAEFRYSRRSLTAA